MKTVFGGTRCEVKLRRQWQRSDAVEVDHATCPLCQSPQEEITQLGDYRVIRPTSTPWPQDQHYLVIPKSCVDWPVARAKRLGGVDRITRVLLAADQLIESGYVGGEIVFFVQIGWNAGQTLGHLHWHLIGHYPVSPWVLPSEGFSAETLVAEKWGLSIYAYGPGAGNCLIVPAIEEPDRYHLSLALNWLIKRGADVFRSEQGLSPEYMVTVRYSPEGQIQYAAYTPILNCWGVPERLLAFLENGPPSLAWPHEVSARYLREVPD